MTLSLGDRWVQDTLRQQEEMSLLFPEKSKNYTRWPTSLDTPGKSFNKCFIDMMIDKILASSFLDFVATYRLHLWNRKKTKILHSHSSKAVLLISAGAMYS